MSYKICPSSSQSGSGSIFQHVEEFEGLPLVNCSPHRYWPKFTMTKMSVLISLKNSIGSDPAPS